MRRQPQDRVSRFVDDLLQRRRPRRFRASAEEVEAMSAAAELSQLRAGAGLPDPQFVERLEHSLRGKLDPAPAASAGAWPRPSTAAVTSAVVAVNRRRALRARNPAGQAESLPYAMSSPRSKHA